MLVSDEGLCVGLYKAYTPCALNGALESLTPQIVVGLGHDGLGQFLCNPLYLFQAIHLDFGKAVPNNIGML